MLFRGRNGLRSGASERTRETVKSDLSCYTRRPAFVAICFVLFCFSVFLLLLLLYLLILELFVKLPSIAFRIANFVLHHFVLLMLCFTFLDLTIAAFYVL